VRQFQNQWPKVAGGERVAHLLKASSLVRPGLRFAAAAGLHLPAPQNLGDPRSRNAFSPGNLGPRLNLAPLRVAVPIRPPEVEFRYQPEPVKCGS